MVLLSYLQSMSILSQMDLDLVKSQQGVFIGRITNRGAIPPGSGREIIGLFPGLMRHEYPRGETPKQANSFISWFMSSKGEFTSFEFQTIGWVHSLQRTWWTRIVKYITEQLWKPLLQTSLYLAVRAIKYGTKPSHYHFFAMMELYNLDTPTFFTPSRD